jgi:nitrate reductase gamma subunit
MSALFAILFYLAFGVFAVGVGRKIAQYWRTPAPLKIPTTPAPLTTAGVVWRMAKEVTIFESLFRSTKWTWLFGWMFHMALALAFVRHLRYVISPDNPFWFLINLEVVQTFGKYAGFAMVAGLLGLLARRIFVDRVRYISAPSDYLMLLLILGIAGSGLMMTFVAHTDIVALKAFMLGLIRFDWQPLPDSPVLLAHLSLVLLLMVIFPFSKLLHAPGVFFSPTRNQKDDAREHRHLAPWAAALDTPSQRGQ